MLLIGVSDDTKYTPIMFTPWSLIHVISGIMFALFTRNVPFGRSFALFFILHGLYEVKDVSTGVINSLPNSIGDQLSATCGFLLGRILETQNLIIISLILFAIFLNPLFSKNGETSKVWKIWTSRA